MPHTTVIHAAQSDPAEAAGMEHADSTSTKNDDDDDVGDDDAPHAKIGDRTAKSQHSAPKQQSERDGGIAGEGLASVHQQQQHSTATVGDPRDSRETHQDSGQGGSQYRVTAIPDGGDVGDPVEIAGGSSEHESREGAEGDDQELLRPMEEVATEWGLDPRLTQILREEGVKHFFPIQVYLNGYIVFFLSSRNPM